MRRNFKLDGYRVEKWCDLLVLQFVFDKKKDQKEEIFKSSDYQKICFTNITSSKNQKVKQLLNLSILQNWKLYKQNHTLSYRLKEEEHHLLVLPSKANKWLQRKFLALN